MFGKILSLNSLEFEAHKSELKAFASVSRYSFSFVFFVTSSGRAIKTEWRR
uniref:Uncharacterized protein n=1 Tax=Arundo donax TaxID=35708 RepID=A0A0A9F321_ARUDO